MAVDSHTHRSGDQGPLTHPQPPNSHARTTQALRATPKLLHSRLRAFCPTPKPSHPDSATSQRQRSRRRARSLSGRLREYFGRERPFDLRACSRRPLRSESLDLALRSLAFVGGARAGTGEGQTVARVAKTFARGAGHLADEGMEVAGGGYGVADEPAIVVVGARRTLFRNALTGGWGWALHGQGIRESRLRRPASGRLYQGSMFT